MGYNKMAQQGFENNLQRQQLEDRRRIYEAQIARDKEAKQQQDFRNSLDLAKYNQLGNYRNDSLEQRTAHGADSIAQRREAAMQRESQFVRKQSQGILTREDTQQHQIDIETLRGNFAQERTDTQQYGNDIRQENAFDHADTMQGRNLGIRQAAINARAAANKARVDGAADKNDTALQLQGLHAHLNALKAQITPLIHAEGSAVLGSQRKAIRDRLQPLLDDQQVVMDAMGELTNVHLNLPSKQPLQAIPGNVPVPQPQRTMSPAPAEDYPSELPPPEMMNAGQGGLYIGQIVTNPSGAKGKVIGFQNGKAMVEANVP